MFLTNSTRLGQHLTSEWQQALAGDPQAQAQWQVVEGGRWSWRSDGLHMTSNGSAWSGLQWQRCNAATLRALQNFVIEFTLRGKAKAVGLSFGAGKDFLIDLDSRTGARHLQLEVDTHGRHWAWRVDGRLVECEQGSWSSDDLVNGQLSLKALGAEEVLFQEVTVHIFQASCQLSIFIPCYRFVQRLRIALRNWCEQSLPSGAYEILVGNPQSPDGTHEHLAAVAASYPHVRVREVRFQPSPRVNVSAMYNHLVDICHGEWIWITDADCLYAPSCAATVISQVQSHEHTLFLGKRLFLNARQTYAVLAGRIDSVMQFDVLARAASSKPPPGKLPWAAPEFERVKERAQKLIGDFPPGVASGLQVMHRSVLKRVPYREIYHGEDGVFIIDCRRNGILSKVLDDFICLHLEHPYAWDTTDGFL